MYYRASSCRLSFRAISATSTVSWISALYNMPQGESAMSNSACGPMVADKRIKGSGKASDFIYSMDYFCTNRPSCMLLCYEPTESHVLCIYLHSNYIICYVKCKKQRTKYDSFLICIIKITESHWGSYRRAQGIDILKTSLEICSFTGLYTYGSLE